jgi:hypothetical protein
MKFQIVSKKTGTILTNELTLDEMIKRVQHSFQDMDLFLLESIMFREKEFVIKAIDPAYDDWIEKKPKDFTVIVRRID